MKTCSVEGCENRVWGKGLCVSHIKRKPIPKLGMSIRTQQKGLKQQVNIDAMRKFFMEIWKERTHESEVSGAYLGKEALSTFFHHILPKSKYPDLAYDKSNIILLTFPEHSNVENDMYKYDIINEKRKELMKKYNLC